MDNTENIEENDQLMEVSTEMAYEFVEEYIIPQLEEFESEGVDEEYIEGAATYVLFTRLVGKMAELGYTVEELKEITDLFYDMRGDMTLH